MEFNMSKIRSDSESSVHGIIVSGEASESEDEDITFSEDCHFKSLDQKVPIITSTTSFLSKGRNIKRRDLLHQKLYEANVSLYKRLISEFDDPFHECSTKILKLNQKTEASQILFTQATEATRKASQNIDDILKKISLDFSHLPSKKPTFHPK